MGDAAYNKTEGNSLAAGTAEQRRNEYSRHGPEAGWWRQPAEASHSPKVQTRVTTSSLRF